MFYIQFNWIKNQTSAICLAMRRGQRNQRPSRFRPKTSVPLCVHWMDVHLADFNVTSIAFFICTRKSLGPSRSIMAAPIFHIHSKVNDIVCLFFIAISANSIFVKHFEVYWKNSASLPKIDDYFQKPRCTLNWFTESSWNFWNENWLLFNHYFSKTFYHWIFHHSRHICRKVVKILRGSGKNWSNLGEILILENNFFFQKWAYSTSAVNYRCI